MKLNLTAAIIGLTFFSQPSFSTEYIHRDLMANTLPGAKCEAPTKAEETALKTYKVKRFAKKFCQTQGYGWGLDEITDQGKVACNECSDAKGLQKCYLEDVTVKCKRIRPGSVGMLPGKG